eukprot:4098550-Amphidinium_carterae.1
MQLVRFLLKISRPSCEEHEAPSLALNVGAALELGRTLGLSLHTSTTLEHTQDYPPHHPFAKSLGLPSRFVKL